MYTQSSKCSRNTSTPRPSSQSLQLLGSDSVWYSTENCSGSLNRCFNLLKAPLPSGFERVKILLIPTLKSYRLLITFAFMWVRLFLQKLSINHFKLAEYSCTFVRQTRCQLMSRSGNSVSFKSRPPQSARLSWRHIFKKKIFLRHI